MFESLCRLIKGKKKRSIPYTTWNQIIEYVGVTLDEINTSDHEEFKKTIRKNVDDIIKKLSELSDDELQKMFKIVKEGRKVTGFTKLWAAGKNQKIYYSELERLFNAINEEQKKRKSEKE